MSEFDTIQTTKQQIKLAISKDDGTTSEEDVEIEYIDYKNEDYLPEIQELVSRDLSEPYSIFTYRYFLHSWPSLCICVYATKLATGERKMIGTIIGKADQEGGILSGYIGMLTVDKEYRKAGIGSKLAKMIIHRMIEAGCDEIVLETEVRL
jgi:peptide alpha-N-acetyltransferase